MKCTFPGCTADPSKDPDVILWRISPKWRAFEGRCQDHIHATPEDIARAYEATR